MDYNIYITLQEEDLKQVGIFELKSSWEGKKFSYDPRRFRFEDKVQMISSEPVTSFEAESYPNKNLITLKIVNGLHELEWEINKQTEKLKLNSILKLLERVSLLNKFSIYIFEDDEIIEKQIEFNNEMNLFLLVTRALNWKLPQNIRIFADNIF